MREIRKQYKDLLIDYINKNKKYEIITNRYEAIKEAFKISCSNDTILILGKGSEKGTIDNDGLSDEQLVKKYIEGVR